MKPAILILSMMLTASSARATHDGTVGRPDLAVGVPVSVSLGIAGIVSAVGTAASLANPKPSRDWLAVSYALGTLNLVCALGFGLTAAIGGPLGEFRPLYYGPALAHFALGAIDIGLAVGAHAKIGRHPIAVVPIGGQDSAGQPIAGVGMRLVGL